MTDNYREGLDFLSVQFPEVNGYDFYRDIFPDNENAGELHMDYSHPNALYLYRDERDEGTERRLRRRTMYKDTWEEDYMTYVEGNPMTLCSGLVYRKKANTIRNAQRMNALIFDLDGVGNHELLNLFHRFKGEPGKPFMMPMPTYLVLSGNGVHVYYVLDEPVDLYPNVKPQAKQLKYHMTNKLWDWKSTSQYKQVQFQSINQGFRMVGSINERYGTEVKAFRIGDRVTLDHVNQYAKKECRIDLEREPEQMEMKAMKYPKKWAGGVKNGEKLYEWWLRKSEEDDTVTGGHRYFYLMTLVIYASKCNIPLERLKADMQIALERLKGIDHTNELTEHDVKNALKAYKRDFYNFTIADIEQLTAIRIDRNRRNGRSQEQHIRVMTAVRDALYPDGVWRKGNGRPSARQRVGEYRQQHPDATKAECIRGTGLSKPTVYKWWNAGEGQSDEND